MATAGSAERSALTLGLLAFVAAVVNGHRQIVGDGIRWLRA